MRVAISGTGLYTPPYSVSNEELVECFNAYVRGFNAEHAHAIERGEVEALEESSAGFIEKASGIKSRYVVDKSGLLDPKVMHPLIPERSNEENSILCEMAITAAREAMAQARVRPEDVDVVIASCSNLPRGYPALAIEVQGALGIQGFGYDMNVACASAAFGIQQAYSMIKAGTALRILVINPEICTAHNEFRDRDCHFIFGDVCTASIIERLEDVQSDGAFEILGTRLITQFSNNIRNNFGFLNRCAPGSQNTRDKLFKQEGRKVFKEVTPMVADLISTHLSENGFAAGDVRRLWLHQANSNMNQLIARKVLGRDASTEEMPLVLDEYANTSSAGSIIAFHKYRRNLQTGDIGVISGFGAGYSAGSIIVQRL
jgi:beta-ketodecanoyl-[acyl-carrier-protein] synthase